MIRNSTNKDAFIINVGMFGRAISSLQESARACDGNVCKFESWQCQLNIIRISCSWCLRVLGSFCFRSAALFAIRLLRFPMQSFLRLLQRISVNLILVTLNLTAVVFAFIKVSYIPPEN